MSKQSSSFAANVLKLVTGSVFTQGLGVLVTPITARVFAHEAFGIPRLLFLLQASELCNTLNI